MSSSNNRVNALMNHIQFQAITMAPPDPILSISAKCNADPTPDKINVGVGAYRDGDGKPFVLNSVRAAEDRIHAQKLNHEYLPMEGDVAFTKASLELAFGKNNPILTSGRISAIQSLSGTGALSVLAGFLNKFPTAAVDGQVYTTGVSKAGIQLPTVYVPNPTWSNHFQIFEREGFKVQQYRYWCSTTYSLDLDGMLADLNSYSPGSIVILHACAHNPTGVDPTPEQWRQIQAVCAQRNLFVVFDMAYLAFASGSAETDAYALRYFVEKGMSIALCQSFAKNFGLYGQRVGTLSIINTSANKSEEVLSQMKLVARTIYSSPPLHGARIVKEILNSDDLRCLWEKDVLGMATRIKDMRQLLVDELKKAGSTKNWDHIISQIGMFSFTGLTKVQCEKLIEEHHVYLTLNGRISMAGINKGNVAKMAKAMHDVSTRY